MNYYLVLSTYEFVKCSNKLIHYILKMRYVLAFIIVYNKTSIIDKSNRLAIYVQNQIGECSEKNIFIKLQFH